jgi:NADPH-dependent curcumin reductase CurA
MAVNARSDRNRMVTLRAYTEEVPGPPHLEVTEGEVPAPGPGQALVETVYVSLDPYLRLSMLPPDSSVPTGGRSLGLGQVVEGRGVARVLDSNVDALEPGDLVVGVTGWQTHALLDAGGFRRVDATGSLSAALGVLGMPGFTAWSGLKFVGQPAPGQTVAVSAAGGARSVSGCARSWVPMHASATAAPRWPVSWPAPARTA